MNESMNNGGSSPFNMGFNAGNGQWSSLLSGLMQNGTLEVPRGGVTNVSVSPMLSILLNMICSPLELALLNGSTEGGKYLADAVHKARGGISSFGESLLDLGRLQEYMSINNPPNITTNPQNTTTSSQNTAEASIRRSQYVLLSDMLATLYYIRDAIRKEQSNGMEGNTSIINHTQMVSIPIAGEHVLYINMFAMSVMYGVRIGHVEGVKPERLDQLIQELYQNHSVKTNNPIEMLILYFMDITSQYTQKVGKQTITADELKSLLTDNGQLNLDKLRDILSR